MGHINEQKDSPIFFDESGKRWGRIQYFTLATISLILTLLYPFIAAAVTAPPVSGFETEAKVLPVEKLPPPSTFAYQIDAKTLPIVGEGPLLRVVRVDQKKGLLADIYSGEVTKTLDAKQLQATNSKPYAIERYGQTNGKRLVLTFDDGPDPLFTPQILDVLAEESIQATFFATGENIAKFPEIAKRIVREGHVLANHTFFHVDFDFANSLRSHQEITQTQRMIRAVTNHNPAYFRIPYGGHDDDSARDSVRGLLEAQRLGYTVVSYNNDSNDWQFTNGRVPTLPEFGNNDIVMLLHDGGGNRSQTVSYVKALINESEKKGYTFADLETLYPGTAAMPLNPVASATPFDKTALAVATSLLVTPQQLIHALFFITLLTVFSVMLLNIILASLQLRFGKVTRRSSRYRPFVSILVPAYNEEAVLEKTIDSLMTSHYERFEIIIINDGSSDNTSEIMHQISDRNRRVRAFDQPNGGKASALNHGLAAARGDIIVAIDADTVFPPETIGQLMRHFIDPKVGAVAGVVKVGNIRNQLTKWQTLEYITGINIQRTAQAFLGAITIVPGACGAWRKQAIIAAGGYSRSTLAEDCDLTISIQEAGYKVVQDLEALSYTEAPERMSPLAKQRFRWTFGNMQVFWKHRNMILRPRYGWLGMFILPYSIFSVTLPLLFAPVLFVIALVNIFTGQALVVLLYFCIGMSVLLFVTLLGLIISKERFRYLLVIPTYRLIYIPLRTYLLYRSFYTALKGIQVGWNKLARTGEVSAQPYQKTPTTVR